MTMIKRLILDWGGTVMVDYALEGPMYLWERVDWIPGIEKSLQILGAKYPLVIATNAPHSGTTEMIKALERVNAARLFSSFYSSRELKVGKPDPLFFLAIAQREEVLPHECIMIGNHYLNDITGAKAAGMRTVFYQETDTPGVFPDADVVIDNMESLPHVIESLDS